MRCECSSVRRRSGNHDKRALNRGPHSAPKYSFRRSRSVVKSLVASMDHRTWRAHMKRTGSIGVAVKVAGLLLSIGATFPEAALAQTSDQWRWTAGIYGYFPQRGGSTTFPSGTTANITVGTSTLINNLKFAASGIRAAQKGPWDLFTDVMYYDVGGSKSQTRGVSIPGIPIPVDITADANF